MEPKDQGGSRAVQITVTGGVITPVSLSEWATHIVVVLKPDGTIRICRDFRLTVNPALKVDKYLLPRTEDIFATLGKGVLHSKIDLLQAYNQLEVEAKELLTITTHKGLFELLEYHQPLPSGKEP